jgi:hypothetical protein
VLVLAPFCISLASAQSAVDINIGFGGAWDSANSGGIDNANSLTNAYGSCTPGGKDANCQSLPKLNAFMLGFGGDVMVKQKLGFGIDFAVQPTEPAYGPLQSRQSFYDFDAVYRPVQSKRANLSIEGGIGGARTSFAITQSGCVGTAVCSSQTSPVGTANHFQEHIGVGVQVFITEHLYVKPQFDIHIVNGLTDQFGSNFVPSAMVWIGYNLGSK